MSDALDRACEALRERGYRVTFPTDRGAPAAVAAPDSGEPVVADGPLALEPLDPAHVPPAGPATAAPDPTTVVDRVADAAPDRTCLFVVAPDGAAAVREVLTDPPAVRAVDGDGCRTFYDVPDRLSTGAGLGCVRADEPPVWREEPATGGLGGSGGDAGAADGETDADDRRLVLTADGTVHAAFEEYAALACPSVEAFPYTYRRGEDRRVHVRNREGREVGVYPSIRAMKADAYRPIPDPLLPEVHLPDGVRLRRAWALAVVEDGGVRFERS